MSEIAPSSTRERHREYEARYRANLRLDPERSAKKAANAREWRRANPEKRKQYDKARTASYLARKAWLIAFRAASRRARRFGLEFHLTHEWAAEKYERGSPLSGLPFGVGPFAPSIDRIDSDGGYTIDNSRMVLRAENLFKNEWSDDVVVTIATAIAKAHKPVRE